MDPLHSRLATARARRALQAAGLPHRMPLVRASSTRNEVHLDDHHVVRTNGDTTDRLRREALLCLSLPRHPWSPSPVAAGGGPGLDYLILRRKPGAPLAHCWPDLDERRRRRAVADLAQYLRLLHETPTPAKLPRIRRAPQLVDGKTLPVAAPLLTTLDRLAGSAAVDWGLLHDVRDLVDRLEDALAEHDESHLVHGDLTFENILWNEEGLSAVIDFEWCRGGPPDLDLDVLFRCVAYPHLHVGPEARDRTRVEDYWDIPVWLAESYPELFEHPRLFDRLLVYALSFEIHLLDRFPLGGAAGRQVGREHPYTRLRALMGGGGHVADVLNRCGLPG